MTRTEHETLTALLDDLRAAYRELPWGPATVDVSHCIACLAAALDNASAPCIRCTETEAPPDTERGGVSP